ncbi:MAG: hypothetical protein JNK79_11625 [Chitinophagaceae bacterium]|nr:hypothetical protein [Chitinophagaceae bacterium]
MKKILLQLFGLLAAASSLQSANGQCCTIIDMAKEAGTFTIRDSRSGRIQLFKPDALEGAELKIGDSVDVKFDSMKVVSVKGVAKTYDLLEPLYNDSCCVVMKLDTLMPDSVFRVTARNISSGKSIYFNLPSTLRPSLDSGTVVFMHPSHGYAMVATRTDSTRKALFGFPVLEKPDN